MSVTRLGVLSSHPATPSAGEYNVYVLSTTSHIYLQTTTDIFDLTLGVAPAAHKNTHKSGGTDAFTNTDVLEAVVKRILESSGPQILDVGNILDGQFLRRVGNFVVGSAPSVVSFQSFRTGEYYDQKSLGTMKDELANQNYLPNALYAVKIRIASNIAQNFDRIGVNKIGGGGPAAGLHVGVYTDALNRPNTVVAEGEITAFDANGFYEVNINQNIYPGVYWLAMLGSQAYGVLGFDAKENETVGSPSGTDVTPYFMLSAVSVYGVALPDPAPAMSLDALRPPRIVLRAG